MITRHHLLPAAALAAAAALMIAACGGSDGDPAADIEQGRQTFRHDTFGDEAFWTDQLRMHEAIAAAVDPATALSVGLKVDAQALPAAVVDGIRNGSVDLTKPATTIALLKLDARFHPPITPAPPPPPAPHLIPVPKEQE